jgi:hypothetical protein
LPAEQRSVSCCKCHAVGNHQYLNTLFECTSRIFSNLLSCQAMFIIRKKWHYLGYQQKNIDMSEQHTEHIPRHSPSVTTHGLCASTHNGAKLQKPQSFAYANYDLSTHKLESWRERCKEGQKSRVWNTRGFHCNLMNAVL